MPKIKPLDERYDGILKNFVTRKLYLNTHMNLTDNTHLEIENVKKILEISEVYIKLLTSNMMVSVWGENLSVSDFNIDGIVVNGKISNIEFEPLQRRNAGA
jgi:sporulation protein YqfC